MYLDIDIDIDILWAYMYIDIDFLDETVAVRHIFRNTYQLLVMHMCILAYAE
jgi:hypothetical protein